MSKYPEQNDSKKRDRRKKAIALSVGTCLLMGIAAFEIYRLSDDPVQKTKSVGLILPDPIDARYQRDLGEIESRLYDIKRLLFVKDAALENARLKTIREKLREKDVLVQNLETEKQSIEAKLEKEQAKLVELEKTIATLIDTVDLHKGTKEQGQEKLYRQLDEERFSHTQEVLKLNQEIAHAKETEEALRTELVARIENEKQLESAKNSTIQLLKTELAQHVDTLKEYENQIADLRNEKTRLTDEINQHHELVRNHEDAGIEQAAYISSLNAKLTETELELAAVISKGQLQDKTIVDLEDSIKSLITRTAGDQQEYDNYRKAQEDRLSQAETDLARLLDEREKLVIELKENYQSRDELNQVAEKGSDLEDQLQIEKTLRAKLSQDHLALDEAYKAYKSTTDESGRSLKDLEEALATEREKVQRLEDELNQNLSKIDALTASLNEERTLTEELSKLKDSLSSKLNETSLVYTQHVNSEQELLLAKQISDFNLATIFSDLQLEKSRLNDSTLELDSLKRHTDNLTLEIARLVDENQILNNKIATREANNPSLSELEKQKDDIEALTLHLQNQLNDERSRIETLKLEQEERQTLIARLNEELDKEKTAARELKESKIALQEQLSATHAQYESTANRLSELESREKERNDLVQKLTDDLEKQKILNSELEDQLANAPKTQDFKERLLLIEQLKKQLEEEKALTANLKTEKEEFENELNAARADKDKLKGIQAEIQSRDEWIEHLTKQLEIEKETNETLARLSNSLESEKGSDIHRLTLELEGLKATHSDRLSEIAALTNQLDSAKERIDYYSDVERMHDAKVDEVDRLTKELTEARKHADTIVNLQQELDQAKAALAKNDTSETNAEVERLNQLLTQAKTENEKIPSLQQEIDELKNAIAKYSENESELNKYKSEYEMLTVEIAALRNENDNLLKEKQSKIEVLTAELEETKASIASLSGNKAELERLNSEYDRLNVEMDRLKNDHAYAQNDKQSRIEALTEELNQAKIAFAKNESLESEVQRLTQSLEEAKAENEKIASLQKELDETKAAIAQHSGSQAELEKLKSDYDRLTLEMDSLKNDHAYAQTEKQSKIEALTEELNQAKIAFAKNESLESEVQRLTQSLEEAKAENEKIASLQKELDETKAAIAQHSGSQAELEKLKSDYDRLTLEMDSLKNDLAYAQTEKQSKIEALTDELNQAKIAFAKNDALEAEIQRLTQLLDQAKTENEKVASLQKELDGTQAAITKHKESEAELEKYKRDYENLNLEISSLKKDQDYLLNEKQSKIDALTQEIESAKQAYASSIQSKEEIEADYEARKRVIEELSLSLEQEKSINEKLKTDTSDLNQKLLTLKDESSKCVENAENRILSLQSQISQEYERMTAIQSELNDKTRHISDIKSDLDEEKGRNLKLIEELQKAEKAHSELNALKKEKEEILQNLNKLKEEISYTESKLSNREKQLADLESEKLHLHDKVNVLHTEKNDLKSDYENRLKQEQQKSSLTIEQMNSKIEGLAKEREELNQKINELQERHKTLELARENSNSSAIAKELKDIEPKLEEFKKELVKKDQKLLDAELTLNNLLLENKKLSEKINEILDARSDDLLSAKGQEIKLKEQILRLENELKQLKNKP